MAMTTPAGVQRPIERALRGRHELGEQTSEEVAERRKQGQGEDHGEVIHPRLRPLFRPPDQRWARASVVATA
jgi:hypothetical protein